MLINSKFVESGDLELNAYTFNAEEFTDLETVLLRAGIPSAFRRLPRDSANREGRGYSIVTPNQLSSLGSILEGHFQSNALFVPTVGGGKNYRCREAVLAGGGPGCEDLTAPDISVARFKCGLIAGEKNWLGGVPSAGQCP